jgi:hypothetical protein
LWRRRLTQAFAQPLAAAPQTSSKDTF